MSLSRSRLAALIANLVLLTLLVAFAIATLVIRLAGDWERHSWGLMLTLKIMWGSWLLLFATVVLTRITIAGWRFRKLRPGEMPAALRRAIAEGIKPASLFESGTTSFTITVVLVSLLGAATLASVLIWIIAGQENTRPRDIALRIIWGTWWVLCIVTVLVRVALFNQQRRKAKQANAKAAAPQAPAPSPNGENGEGGRSESPSTETTTGKAP
jgi:hypothetical protein